MLLSNTQWSEGGLGWVKENKQSAEASREEENSLDWYLKESDKILWVDFAISKVDNFEIWEFQNPTSVLKELAR